MYFQLAKNSKLKITASTPDVIYAIVIYDSGLNPSTDFISSDNSVFATAYIDPLNIQNIQLKNTTGSNVSSVCIYVDDSLLLPCFAIPANQTLLLDESGISYEFVEPCTNIGGTGSSWHSGSGVPSNSLGVDGDFYLDVAVGSGNGDVYKKVLGAYVLQGNIKGDPGADGVDGVDGINGADGADGADGKTILNGVIAPSGGIGTDGDFYLDTVTLELYGPKTAGSWGTPVTLGGGSDLFVSDFTVYLTAPKTFGKYASGSVVPANGKTARQVILDAAVEAIPPTLTLTTVTGTIPFNTTSISNVLNFTKVINMPGTSIATLSLERARSSAPTSWTVLTTNTALTTFTDTMTDSAYNADDFLYRLIVTDNLGALTTTPTLTILTAAYVAPTVSFSGNLTRELGNVNVATGNLTGTITRQSPLVNMTNYQVQRSIDGGAYSNLGSTVSISGGSASIDIIDATVPLNSISVAYRVIVTDAMGTGSALGGRTISFVHQRFVGYSANAVLTLAQILALSNAELSNAKARTIAGVTAGVGLYTYIVYASAAGDLSGIIQDGATPVLGAFTKLTDVTGTNSFGANVSYRVYKSNATQAFTSATLAIS